MQAFMLLLLFSSMFSFLCLPEYLKVNSPLIVFLLFFKVGICELPFHPISSEVVGGVGGT